MEAMTEKKTEVPEQVNGTKEGSYTHILQKPFKYGNATFEKFEFDFEKLTGNDMLAIENEMAALGEYAITPEVSTSFIARMSARAANVGSDVILALPLKEFGKIKSKCRDFLVNANY